MSSDNETRKQAQLRFAKSTPMTPSQPEGHGMVVVCVPGTTCLYLQTTEGEPIAQVNVVSEAQKGDVPARVIVDVIPTEDYTQRRAFIDPCGGKRRLVHSFDDLVSTDLTRALDFSK